MNMIDYNNGNLGIISEAIGIAKDAVNAIGDLVTSLDTGPAEGPQNRKAAAGIQALLSMGYTEAQIRTSPALLHAVEQISGTSVWKMTITTIQQTAPSKMKYLLSLENNVPAPGFVPTAQQPTPPPYRVLSDQESVDLLARVLGYLVNQDTSLQPSTAVQIASAAQKVAESLPTIPSTGGEITTAYSQGLSPNPPAPQKNANLGWIFGIGAVAIGAGIMMAPKKKKTASKKKR